MTPIWLTVLLTTLGPWTPLITAIIAVLAFILLNKKDAILEFGKTKVKFGRTRRSCYDCIMMVTGIISKYRTNRDRLSESTIRNQMCFAEQKIQEAHGLLTRTFWEMLETKKKLKPELDNVLVQKDFVIYEEVLARALNGCVKDELKRSFKENGFHDIGGMEFSIFVKSKTKSVIAMGRDYLRTRYPFNGMIIPIQERFDALDVGAIEDMMFEIYIKAKEIKLETDAEIKELDKLMASELDELISERRK